MRREKEVKKTLWVYLEHPNEERKIETEVGESITSAILADRLGVKRYRVRAWSRTPLMG